MERDLIEIDEELCVGCGNCVPNCHQGALQVIDGKVRLLSDLMCEGLGACVGHCPTGAMRISKQEAQPYDEALVMDKMIAAGTNTLRAHLEHLIQHRQDAYLTQARAILAAKGLADPTASSTGAAKVDGAAGHHSAAVGGVKLSMAGPLPHAHDPHARPGAHGHGPHGHHGGGCPGSQARVLGGGHGAAAQNGAAAGGAVAGGAAAPRLTSELRQWPVQLHLLNPGAPYLQGAHLLLAADCVAYAYANFHKDFLKGRALAIACPKLDSQQESYIDKLAAMIDGAELASITILMMEVPCCRGLHQLVKAAQARASRPVPVSSMIVGLEGDVREM